MSNTTQSSLSPRDFYLVLAMAYLPAAEEPPEGTVPPSTPSDRPPREWTYVRLGAALGMSASRVHDSVQQLLRSGLLVGKGLKSKVNKGALADFIIHGARHAFPATLGPEARGIPTGLYCQAFDRQDLVLGLAQAQVWPFSKGVARGPSILPLCPAVLVSYDRSRALHQALVTFDVLRTGGVRERAVAEAFFRRTLAWSS